MEIELCGYKVQIDEEDYERVMSHKWYANKGTFLKGGGIYFACVFYKKPRHSLSLHRFIMNCVYKDGLLVDHINGDTLDNRKSNLRVCTRAGNARNAKKRKDTSTGYKGVIYYKKLNKYRARIVVNNVKIHLGYYKTAEEAYSAYCDGSKKYHGEFGRIE